MTTSRAQSYDLAIIGGGLFGSLLALALRRHRPDVDFALIEPGDHFGGSLLEAAIADEIPAPLADIVESATVKLWPGCFVTYPGRSQRFDDPVLLVDPRQLHLDMIDHPRWAHCQTGCADVRIRGDRVVHSRGELRARLIVDAGDARIQSHLEIERMTRYRDFRQSHDLDLPIIADMSATAGDWSFLQLFPIDGERMVVEHLRHRPARPASLAGADRGIDADAVISLAGAGGTETPGLPIIADHFPSLLQMAAEIAAGFVAIEYEEAAIRSFFAEHMQSGRDRSRRMFELVRLCRGAR